MRSPGQRSRAHSSASSLGTSSSSNRSGRGRRWLSALGGAALLGALFPATALVGADPVDPADRFEAVPSSGEFTPAFRPFGLDATQPVTVVVELSGDSVAVRKAKAPGKKISHEQKEAAESELKAKQDSLTDAIGSRGGKVLAQYQDALNGIKVEIPQDQVRALAGLPNVTRIRPVGRFELDNTTSVPFIGAPQVWAGVNGPRGEGIKIGIIDTGIDYTHANFGGPGTALAFQQAKAHNTEPADPALLGPNAPKVKGGTDLVGDDYNASSDDPARRVPHPSPNPLDCNGHGSHVAGTAAGFGVTAAGKTYPGPYDASTLNQSFAIGPGVAPKADLFAIRVFGCEGSTNVVVDAIDWAVGHEMDVINMSLGRGYGTADDASAVASENAAKAGLLVVASAGNSGAAPYITGSPATGNGAISVAAIDANPSFPGATLALSTGKKLTVQNSNAATFSDGRTLPVLVLRTAGGGVSLGCKDGDFADPGIAGKLVVTRRGDCARVDRAIFGQKHGAAAVAMINTDPNFPPFEGPIPGVTIPFFGVRGVLGGASDGDTLVTANRGTATLANTSLTNPGFRGFAGFTSGGPRGGDSALKPDISAPGVSTNSTASGTGNGARRLSGTSMAAPHVAGVAALAKQAHPGWDAADVRAAIVNTGDPTKLAGYRTSRGGSGLVQPIPATRTSAVAVVDDDGATNLSFGFAEFRRDFTGDRSFEVRNHGQSPATFNLSVTKDGGSEHSAVLEQSSVTVEPGGAASVEVTLTVPAATVGDSRTFREVSGVISLAPVGGANGGATLRVPYYVVPRARSNVRTELDDELSGERPSGTATVSNADTAVAGTANFFAWGLTGEKQDLGSVDLRAVGVQASDSSRFGRMLVFAVNTHARWSSASVNEFDVLVDSTGSGGPPDLLLVGADLGLLTEGSFNGQMVTAVFDLKTGRGRLLFFANAPTDGSTILLPLRASDLKLSPANPRFTYSAQAFGLLAGTRSVIPGPASFNAFNPAISQGQSVEVAPNSAAAIAVSIDPTEFTLTPPLGLMVVALDNAAGGTQAQLIRVEKEDRP